MRIPEPALFVLGHDEAGGLRCLTMRVPARYSPAEMLDSGTLESVAVAQYRGNAFKGELAIPIDIFSPTHAIFVKLERRSWFFDEAGWLEVPSARSEQTVGPRRDVIEARRLAIR